MNTDIWTHAPEWAEYRVVDAGMNACWHEQRPTLDEDGCWVSDGKIAEDIFRPEIKVDEFDIRSSFLKRPCSLKEEYDREIQSGNRERCVAIVSEYRKRYNIGLMDALRELDKNVPRSWGIGG